MASRSLILAFLLLAPTAVAEELQFKGRVLETRSGDKASPIERMIGSRYARPGGTPALLARAGTCLAELPGVALAEPDLGNGRLEAEARFDFRKGWSTRSVRSKFAVEAGEGHFRVVHSGLGYAPMPSAEAASADYVAISRDEGWWNEALEALLEREQSVIDCMFR